MSGRSVGRFLARAVAIGVGVWGALAIIYDGPSSIVLAAPLSIAFAVVSALAPRWPRGWLALGLLWADVIGCWLTIEPSNDRAWLPEQAELAQARIEGDLLTIRNVRNFRYRTETDFTPRWETRTYDLSRIRGLDVFVSDWGSRDIAHTITSWELEGGEHLAISIETRKEEGEAYDPIRGLYRQFELYYAVADERDVIALRTSHRHERVLLYRLSAAPEVARALLESYVREMQRLETRPEWYSAVTHNCSTTTRIHAASIGVEDTLDWRVLFNGHLDEMFYERGVVDTSMPLAALREASDITARAQATPDEAPDFSSVIRESLPPRPSPR